MAVGAGLSIALVAFDTLTKLAASYLLLLIISMLAFYLLFKIKGLLKARAKDVDYFHNQIIEYEKLLPKNERILTAFKVYQKYYRHQTTISDHFTNFDLTEKVISELTEKGKGHTRRILDTNLFNWFVLVWITFHLISVITLFLAIIDGV